MPATTTDKRPLEDVLRRVEDPFHLAIASILAWIAASDGDFDPAESALFSEFADSHSEVRIAMRAGRRGDAGELRLPCKLIGEMSAERRELLLDLAITMSLADGYLKPSESHILLFLADLTGLGRGRLDERFRRATDGVALPKPGRIDTASWWELRSRTTDSDPSSPDTDAQRIEALAVLGLNGSATADQVDAAYRTLASIHHPDRFATLGESATRVAAANFRRIQTAYEYLRGVR